MCCEYVDSRVAVMRGQVVTPQGIGIVGIRVSVDRDSRFGFTLTRQGGWWVYEAVWGNLEDSGLSC